MPDAGDYTGYRAETQGWAIRDLSESAGGSSLTGWETDGSGNLVCTGEDKRIKMPVDALGNTFAAIEGVNAGGQRLAALLLQDTGDGSGGWVGLQYANSTGATVAPISGGWGETTLRGEDRIRFMMSPPGGPVAIYLIMDSTGNLLQQVAAYHELRELGADPATPADGRVRFYAKDVGGKTSLMALFPSGSAQQIAIEP